MVTLMPMLIVACITGVWAWMWIPLVEFCIWMLIGVIGVLMAEIS